MPRYSGGMASQPTPTPAPNVRVVQAEGYRDTYVNSVQLRATMHDFQLVLGRIGPDPAGPAALLTNFETLYFSPSQAKALLHVLRNNVEAYESQFGSIVMPMVPQVPPTPEGKPQ